MKTTPPGVSLIARRLRRSGWLLWMATFALLVSLSGAVVVLYLPIMDLIGRELADSGTSSMYYALTGLVGLVIVFCLYTALKQRELQSMRDALQGEEMRVQEVRTRLAEMLEMFQVSTALNLQLKPDVILEIIVRRVVSAMHAQQASIMIYDAESGELETRASYGLESEFARNARRRMGEPIAGWVAEHGQSVILNETGERHGMEGHFKTDRHITSALSTPLRIGERCVGVLNVNRINHPDPFDEHHREVLSLFAEHVAAVIDRAETMDRLGSRSRELEEANTRLVQLNAMKDVFLSTASHELKTPLTSVIAYAELLDDHEDRLDREQRADFQRRLRSEANRLMCLIEDILDLTRLESGKYTLHTAPVSPNQVVHSAVETLSSQAARRHLTVRETYQEDLPEMRLDESKILQVVTNLLANAIKFSPDHGTVEVRTSREPRYVYIEVRDHGPGIEPDDAAHIFELFGQSRRTHGPRDGGLGIGLHLVRRITELHGGHVGVNSRPGEGSGFWVRLPMSLARDIATGDVLQQVA